jgi:hypothetical protein
MRIFVIHVRALPRAFVLVTGLPGANESIPHGIMGKLGVSQLLRGDLEQEHVFFLDDFPDQRIRVRTRT